MPSRLYALRQALVIALAGGVLACTFGTGIAHADSCLTVDSTGACFGAGPTVPSQTVGGPTTVPTISTPAESVTSPTSACLLVTCIAKGDTLVAVPSVTVPTVTVPVPQETTPAVTVPLGSPSVQNYLVRCAPSGVNAGVAEMEQYQSDTLQTTTYNLNVAFENLNGGGFPINIVNAAVDVVFVGVDVAFLVVGSPIAFEDGFAATCL